MTEKFDNMLNHATFREQIAAALAGGLSAAEREAFEQHAAACESCAAELSAARQAEEKMMALMADARPVAGLEDRVIQRLRAGRERLHWLPRTNWVHPAVRKAVTGVAAAILLGGFGYVATQVVEGERERYATSAPANSASPDGYLSYGYQQPYPKSASIGAGVKLNESVGAEFGISGDRVAGAKEGESLGRSATEWSMYARAPQPARPQAEMRDGRAADAGGDGAANGPTFNLQNQGGLSAGQRGGGGGGAADRKLGEPYYAYDGNDSIVMPSDDLWFEPGKLGVAEGKSQQLAQQGQQMPSLNGVIQTGGGDGRHDVKTRAGVQVQDLSRGVEAQVGKPPSGGVEGVRMGEQITQRREAQTVDRNRVITDLQSQAEKLLAEKRTNEAEGVVDQIRVLDPTNAFALNFQSVPQEAPRPAATQATQRKIIRNGNVEFEVDRFDSAFAQVVKLVQEAGGYVGTTDSEKLPNGKVKGTVTVRVPPDRLDTLVLQLRGIGDLKSQKLEAQDVSKKYSDLDSELRAARAMEERLLAIIKEGKGQIKDLLAAEKELGNWRTKIETITGELRYFDNLVAMSTLHITLQERNIATAATAVESETIDAGLESEDVEKARADVLKAIEEAKGRVIQSDLKRYDAGQFGATIVAEVPPDRAGALLDRIKQIGKVARLDVQRKTSTPEHRSSASGATNPPVRVEKRDTRLNLSLYNLANVAPRQTTTLNLAADDVEQAYRAILDRVSKAGGRIVTSNIARSKPEQMTAAISFEVPSAQAEAVAGDVRAAGEVVKLNVTENPDVQNVTTAKRGYTVSLVSSASIAPRETQTMQLAAEDVRAARDKILAAAQAGGARVLSSQLNETDAEHATAKLDLDVKRTVLAAVEKALADAGQTINRQSSRSTDTENTLDTKVRLTLTVVPADQLPPRETTTMAVELRDVESAMGSLQATAASVGGRVVESNLSKDREGRSQAKVVVEVPLEKAGEVVRSAKDLGAVRAIEAGKNLQVPSGALARARIDVTFGNAEAIVAPDQGLWASIRRGLSTSLAGLAWSVQLIVIGLCFVLPWVLILWGAWRLIKRRTNVARAASP